MAFKGHVMSRFRVIAVIVALAFSLYSIKANDAKFFRVVGSLPTTITAFTADGYITWSNDPTNDIFTIQTSPDLSAEIHWVDYLQVSVTNSVTTCRIIDPNPPAGMVFIPPGIFQMGDSFNELDANFPIPVHSVFVSGCYMDLNDVTKALWDDVQHWATTNGYTFDNTGLGKAANHPVVNINWYDTAKWCNARSERESLTPCYYTDAYQTNIYRTGRISLSNACVKWDASGYRLLTEAEWEKAARGGLKGNRFPWGDTITHSQANYYSQTNWSFDISPTRGFNPLFATNAMPYTSPVGCFAPNGYGLYDMAGNVFQTCWDGFGLYPANMVTDPHGPDNRSVGFAMLRGGSWINRSSYPFSATAFRFFAYSGIFCSDDTGFRCVRSSASR
jgi:formylglycine-generating enzyme